MKAATSVSLATFRIDRSSVPAILAEIRSIRSELAELREQVGAAQAERPK